MMTGRFLLMFVVMTATLAVRRPVLAVEPVGVSIERVTFTQRLGTGLARPLTRIGLLRRVALHVPAPRLIVPIDHTTVARIAAEPDAYRTCLPPPVI